MYFWCFGFRGELGFLNCDDVCMCVVNKQFELLEFVSESVYAVEEVLSIINNLDNKNSPGYDDISNKLSKSRKEEVCTPLTVIINQSLLDGIFPDTLKVALVKPLFKKGEKNCFNNYRPISLLPIIANIFERDNYFQLYTYFNKTILLAEQQYGFRPQYSIEVATIKLIDSIVSYLDDKKKILKRL